ncbi:hypothetical protein JW964_20665 [candidate division KSB1 bacterium]|nr:hypothetical protein [candidate division KSB1 bacterium]
MCNASKSFFVLLIAIIGTSLFFTVPIHAANNGSVAILNLESTNLSASLTTQVNQTIIGEASRKTSTISNGQLLSALRRERLSKSAMLANADLTSRIGRSVGASRVLTGLVSRVNDIYIVTLKLTDVNSKSVRQVTKNYRGNFNQFLSTSVKDAVAEILR